MALEDEYTLTRDVVTSRIAKLEGDDAPTFEVYRVKNSEVIETFIDEDEASDFIDERDYDTNRVKIQGKPGLNDDDAAELEALRDFDSEASSDIPDWKYGVPVFNENQINGDFARERFEDRAPPGVDLDSLPYSLIDWDQVAEELIDDFDYAALNGTKFYCL
jgi:hypothetical protein